MVLCAYCVAAAVFINILETRTGRDYSYVRCTVTLKLFVVSLAFCESSSRWMSSQYTVLKDLVVLNKQLLLKFCR